MSAEAISEVTRPKPMSGSNIAGGVPEDPTLDINDNNQPVVQQTGFSGNSVYATATRQVISTQEMSSIPNEGFFTTPHGEMVSLGISVGNPEVMQANIQSNVDKMIKNAQADIGLPAVNINGQFFTLNAGSLRTIRQSPSLAQNYFITAQPVLHAIGSEPTYTLNVVDLNTGRALMGDDMIAFCNNTIPAGLAQDQALAQA